MQPVFAAFKPRWNDQIPERFRGLPRMKVCYCDESGTGDEPIAVMVGILVDCQRMHITKDHWKNLLDQLSEMTGKTVTEIHTRDFYAGNGPWRNLDGPLRARIIATIFEWLRDRKHHVVYTSVCKTSYHSNFALQRIPDELNTIWRFLGFHLVLAIQKYCQKEPKNKGHTFFVFDNENREEMRFTDIICHPRAWSDNYYGRAKKQSQLDQVVDVPYFGDSTDVSLIQVADFAAYFLRRYAEIKEGLIPARYTEEEHRIDGWMEVFTERSIGTSMMYPKVGRNSAEALFFDNASTSIRSLA
ncbi:MAG: DUF3800 domain-containing protein [Acidobacteriia bacterium]|nr:DUF3800 domain-containing protein [Terriglobia bacterium]